MACDPQTLVANAVPIQCCIPAGMQPSVLISLLCQIRDNGGTGGALTPFIVENETAPALPYSYTATQRTHVEIEYRLVSNAAAVGSMTIAKTGASTKKTTLVSSGVNTLNAIVSLILGPGDALTITDTSAGAGSSEITFLTRYIG